MTDASQQNPASISLLAQAEFLDGLIGRCVMFDGTIAGDVALRLTKEEVDRLTQISNRLHLMSPLETQIRKLVSRR